MKKKKKRKHCSSSSTRAPSSHADHARGTGASRRDERGSAEKEESKEESKRGGRRGRAGEYWREPRMPLCLSFAPLLFSSLALLLPWEITDTPLAPPRSRVSLRALAPPTHRAGATRRGRCDTTGREARKEDLDAERLCMVLRSRKRGGKGGRVALGEDSDDDRTGFFLLFFLRVIGETNHSFSSFSLLGERPFSRERAVSSSLCLLSRRERECDRGCCCSTSTRPRRRCRRRLQSSSSAAKHGQSPAPPSPLLFLQASRRAVAGLSHAAAIPAASPWPLLMRPLERSTRRLSGEGGIEVIER